VFKAARKQCPTLDTTNAKVTVTGSLTFASPALTRKATIKLSGTIVAPQACTAGQCAAAEALLKSSFDSVTCTGTSDCTCTIAKEDKLDDATTYTVSGNTITTNGGETYDFCEKGTSFEYTGKSAGAEDGVWTLTKR
jgi:cytoskeletal protein RodZ